MPRDIDTQRRRNTSRAEALRELREDARNDRRVLGYIEYYAENHWLASGVTLRSLANDGLAQRTQSMWGETRYRISPRRIRETR